MVWGRPEFVPVLPDSFHRELPIWAAARAESLRSMAVRAAIVAIRHEISERRSELAA
jgi:hypothetical protein